LSWEVRLAAKAQKDLDPIHGTDRALVQSRFLTLGLNPRSFGSIQLKGSQLHRLRAGDWRLIYEIIDEQHMVRVARILRRSEKTYRGV
jgi:mRNA interferase RelE/StbE